MPSQRKCWCASFGASPIDDVACDHMGSYVFGLGLCEYSTTYTRRRYSASVRGQTALLATVARLRSCRRRRYGSRRSPTLQRISDAEAIVFGCGRGRRFAGARGMLFRCHNHLFRVVSSGKSLWDMHFCASVCISRRFRSPEAGGFQGGVGGAGAYSGCGSRANATHNYVARPARLKMVERRARCVWGVVEGRTYPTEYTYLVCSSTLLQSEPQLHPYPPIHHSCHSYSKQATKALERVFCDLY